MTEKQKKLVCPVTDCKRYREEGAKAERGLCELHRHKLARPEPTTDSRQLLILQTIARMRHTDVQECDGCGRPIEVIEDCEYNDAIDAIEELIQTV